MDNNNTQVYNSLLRLAEECNIGLRFEDTLSAVADGRGSDGEYNQSATDALVAFADEFEEFAGKLRDLLDRWEGEW